MLLAQCTALAASPAAAELAASPAPAPERAHTRTSANGEFPSATQYG